jgi:polar amino acid transport system substrate-binding protein
MRKCQAALVLVFCWIAACAAIEPSRSPVIDRIRTSGELRVGTAGDYPPLNALDGERRNFGLEPDLAEFLAKSLGVRLRFVNLSFGQLMGALEGGRVDAVLSGMTMTPERNQRVAFAGPYFISGSCVLTRSEELARVGSPRDLDRSSLTITAVEGTTSEILIRDAMPSARYTAASSQDAAVQSVIDGTSDAMITDFPICVVQAARRREEGLIARGQPFTFEPIGVALPANDPLFVNLVENYLASLERTGVLTQLRDKWFHSTGWVRRLP